MMPALARQAPDAERAWERGLYLLHPFWMLQHLSNNAHALAAVELGARGDGLLLAGANAGAQALGAAGRALACGAIDAAVVVAYDTLLEPETLVELATRGASTSPLGTPVPAPLRRTGGRLRSGRGGRGRRARARGRCCRTSAGAGGRLGRRGRGP